MCSTKNKPVKHHISTANYVLLIKPNINKLSLSFQSKVRNTSTTQVYVTKLSREVELNSKKWREQSSGRRDTEDAAERARKKTVGEFHNYAL